MTNETTCTATMPVNPHLTDLAPGQVYRCNGTHAVVAGLLTHRASPGELELRAGGMIVHLGAAWTEILTCDARQANGLTCRRDAVRLEVDLAGDSHGRCGRHLGLLELPAGEL